jgi:outer membrane protein assembly factor BamD
VLGHNYPSSTWYQEAFKKLGQQDLAPAMGSGSWMSSLRK